MIGQFVPQPEQDEDGQLDDREVSEDGGFGACEIGFFRLLVLLQVLYNRAMVNTRYYNTSGGSTHSQRKGSMHKQ